MIVDRRTIVLAALAIVGILSVVAWTTWSLDRPRRLRERAEASLAEARAEFAIDRAAEACRAFERVIEADPTNAEAWRSRLDRLRVLDRPVEALRIGRAALSVVGFESRRGLLASTTLAALAELPDIEARSRLDRWIAADPDDLDARVARLARIAANPHPGDPNLGSRIADLSKILDRDPNHIPAREALLMALADSGEPDRGRLVLEGWPESARDARFDRLRGRWDLDYDRRADRAAEAYARALIDLPHDWKSHYGLARSLRALGRDSEAQKEAEAVARLRERLDPMTLAPRLIGNLTNLDDPRALFDMAALCESVGLATLGEAWSREARARRPSTGAFPNDR